MRQSDGRFYRHWSGERECFGAGGTPDEVRKWLALRAHNQRACPTGEGGA